MTHEEFIAYINKRLTKRCALPFKLPRTAVEDVISDTLDWFYKNYDDALEQTYLIIKQDNFQGSEYKKTRAIKLPDCVMYTGRVFDSGANFTYSNHESIGVSSPENLVQRVAYESFRSLSQQFTLKTVSTTFNENSKYLRIQGRNPRGSAIAEVFTKIPEIYLSEDKYVKDFAVGSAMKDLSLILGLFDYELPGGISINAEKYEEMGEKIIEEIKEKIEEEPQMFFYTDDGI